MSTSATVSTTREIQLEPSLRRTLLLKLKSYARLDQQIKALEHQKEVLKETIGSLRDETGEMSIELEGFVVTLVAPTRSVLNHKKLIAMGCAAAWIEQATEQVPSRAYNKISVPAAGDAA